MYLGTFQGLMLQDTWQTWIGSYATRYMVDVDDKNHLMYLFLNDQPFGGSNNPIYTVGEKHKCRQEELANGIFLKWRG